MRWLALLMAAAAWGQTAVRDRAASTASRPAAAGDVRFKYASGRRPSCAFHLQPSRRAPLGRGEESGLVRQGDVIRVRTAGPAVAARMDGRTVRLFVQPEGGRLGLMPVPAQKAPGKYALDLLSSGGKVLSSETVTVRDARFPTQNVVLGKATAELKPSPGEMDTVDAFVASVTETRHWQEPLAIPVPGCMTSPFGVKRLRNGRPTGQNHGGIDQRAPAGSAVRAVADGVVKLVRPYNIHGGTVGIDHGQGLESMYLHLSRFTVAEGAVVHKGDVIGYSGSTGRSNAPHLHWSLYANGVPVNPLQWVGLKPCAVRH